MGCGPPALEGSLPTAAFAYSTGGGGALGSGGSSGAALAFALPGLSSPTDWGLCRELRCRTEPVHTSVHIWPKTGLFLA